MGGGGHKGQRGTPTLVKVKGGPWGGRGCSLGGGGEARTLGSMAVYEAPAGCDPPSPSPGGPNPRIAPGQGVLPHGETEAQGGLPQGETEARGYKGPEPHSAGGPPSSPCPPPPPSSQQTWLGGGGVTRSPGIIRGRGEVLAVN